MRARDRGGPMAPCLVLCLALCLTRSLAPSAAGVPPAGAGPGRLTVGSPQAAVEQVRTNEDARLMQEFTKRVQAYAGLRDQLASELPTLGSDATPERLHANRMELARRIRVKRGRAHEGNIFSHDIRGLFRRLIARSLTADEVAALRADLRGDEAPHFVPRVNLGYLGLEGLVAVPPALLQNFPELPADLEYRLIGEDLVLRDARAGLIVDFVHDALPRRGY